jgi:hypothetical protein
VRGCTSAAVAVVLAATGHTLAGGAAAPAWLLLAVTLLAAPVAVAVAGRRPSLWRTAGIVVAAQALLHTAFAAVGDAAPAPGGGHSHAVLLAATADAAPADAAMVAGHLAAAAVTVAVIARAESVVQAALRGIRRLLRRVTPSLPLPVRPPLSAPAFPTTATLTLLAAAVTRRGPPVLGR